MILRTYAITVPSTQVGTKSFTYTYMYEFYNDFQTKSIKMYIKL